MMISMMPIITGSKIIAMMITKLILAMIIKREIKMIIIIRPAIKNIEQL